jgi:hypothetical protein
MMMMMMMIIIIIIMSTAFLITQLRNGIYFSLISPFEEYEYRHIRVPKRPHGVMHKRTENLLSLSVWGKKFIFQWQKTIPHPARSAPLET